jgi:hypothetical protein
MTALKIATRKGWLAMRLLPPSNNWKDLTLAKTAPTEHTEGLIGVRRRR